jgi:benzoylformate decarboxylase
MKSDKLSMITGRSAFLRLLCDEGVDILFGNPGTTELAIMDALPGFPDLRYVLGLQEAIVVAMADGYSRASGRLAACNVHVAPGLGNAMGSLYNAKFFGSPVLITAGQQEQGHGLMEPLLYDPLVPIAQSQVKWAVEVNRLADLPRIVRRAAKIATTPPTGPVFISLPGDILDAEGELDLLAASRVRRDVRPSVEALEALADRILAAQNPVLLCGHEVATRDALREVEALAEALGVPVLQQSVPYGAHYRSEHPAFLGALTRNQQQVRSALEPHDLLVCLGADVLRMSVWSAIDPLPPGMTVVQISERDHELAKNYPAEIAIRADLRESLRALLPVLEQRMPAARRSEVSGRMAAISARNWSARRSKLAAEAAALSEQRPIDARAFCKHLSDAIPAGAVVVDEGLTTTFPLLGMLPLRDAHSYFGLASGGIGFAMGGAIGVSLALPQRPVVAVIGDGSAMYSVQALWTAANLKLPITYVIANNRSYRILKERMVSLRGVPSFTGMDLRHPLIDWSAMATAYGLPSRRVDSAAELGAAVRDGISSGAPNVIDVSIADGFGT